MRGGPKAIAPTPSGAPCAAAVVQVIGATLFPEVSSGWDCASPYFAREPGGEGVSSVQCRSTLAGLANETALRPQHLSINRAPPTCCDRQRYRAWQAKELPGAPADRAASETERANGR